VGVSKNRMAAKVSIPFLEVPEGFLCSIKVSANTRCKNKVFTAVGLPSWSGGIGWGGGRGIGIETEISHYER
jgi:hypothetical protein